MASYYVQWLDEGPLITILHALRHLDNDTKIIVVELIINHLVNQWIAESIVHDFQEVTINYVPDDYDHIYHGWADYSDSYYTD